MKIKNQYDFIGKDYIKGQKEYFSKREGDARKFIKKFLTNLDNKKILDIGCGHGEDIIMCEKLGAKEIYGLDISSVMIEEARKSAKNPEKLYVGDIEKTIFENNFFDIVISRFSLNYLEKIDKALEEIARILKKGGIFIAILPHPFRDLTLQKNQIYGKREIIEMNLYENKVKIMFPTHTLQDYFSGIFFKNFDLKEIMEEDAPEEYMNDKARTTPGFLGIRALKR